MRVLFCGLEAPIPPLNGLRLQMRHLAIELARQQEVRIVAFQMPDQAPDLNDLPTTRLVPRPATRLPARLRSVARTVLTGKPLGVEEYTTAMRAPLAEEVARFGPDVLHVSSGELSLAVRDHTNIAAIMSAVDSWYLGRKAQVMAASGLKRALLRNDARRVRLFEATHYRKFDRVVVVSEEDKRVLASLDPSLHVAVIPNGVDSEFFMPQETGLVQNARIIFHGSMHYAPNVVAAGFLAREIMPKVRAAVPAAHLVIVGRSPDSRVRALNNLSDVHVTGSVPDIRPWLLGSQVYACPMKSGSGIKNKLLEAMACGLPCVVTPLSLGGMTARPDREVLIGRDADEFAANLVRVLSHATLAHTLGTAAREYVTTHHTWEAVARAYLKLYRGALTDRERRTPSIGPTLQGGGGQEL